MDALNIRPRGLLKLVPLLVASFSTMLLLSIYYLPTAENAVSYFGFRHGSSWDLAHGVSTSTSAPTTTSTSESITALTPPTNDYNGNNSADWASHLSAVSASAKAARPHATGTAHVNIPPTGPTCQLIDGASEVLVVMKTSAVEIDAKLPTQLSTVLSCIPNFLLVSDLNQDFHGHEVYDAMWDVDQRYKESEPEFEYQRTLQAYRDSAVDLDLMRTRDSEHLGRRLEKWMDVPALRLAGKLWPDVSWYVVLDAQTYLSFRSLLEVVADLDPNVPLYTGDERRGYLISRGAMRLFEGEFEKGGKERWEEGTVGASVGGGILELAMEESGVAFKSLPHGSVLQDNSMESFSEWESIWCRPAVSWKYVGSAQMDQIWKWERHFLETTGNAVITFKDVFEGLVEPKIRKGHKAGWENYAALKVLLPLRVNSTDEERRSWEGLEELHVDPTASWDACEKACQLGRGCISWQFGPGRCNLGNSVTVGKKTEGDVKEHGLTISGWNIEKIKRWKERMGPCT
jgi:hypothetical protein